MFRAAIEIIPPLFQKSKGDMSQPKHHKEGKVSIHTGVLPAPAAAPAPAPAPAPDPALTPRYLKGVMRQQKMREKMKP